MKRFPNKEHADSLRDRLRSAGASPSARLGSRGGGEGENTTLPDGTNLKFVSKASVDSVDSSRHPNRI